MMIYVCGKCGGNITHSIIPTEIPIRIFKCRECGRERYSVEQNFVIPVPMDDQKINENSVEIP